MSTRCCAAMHAQAVGEALSGSESGEDEGISGLAAAMGRLRGSSAHPSATGDAHEDDSGEEDSTGDDATDEESKSESGAEAKAQQHTAFQPHQAAAPGGTASEQSESEDEDDGEGSEDEEPPQMPREAVPEQRSQSSSKSPEPAKSKKQQAIEEARLTTVKVAEGSDSRPASKSKGSKQASAQAKEQPGMVPNGAKKGKDKKTDSKSLKQNPAEVEEVDVSSAEDEGSVVEVRVRCTCDALLSSIGSLYCLCN